MEWEPESDDEVGSDHGIELESDEEYDWAAESTRPASVKGLHPADVTESWVRERFRMMVWDKYEGRWHGRWKWAEDRRHMNLRSERAINS